jgi:hypothetical protein
MEQIENNFLAAVPVEVCRIAPKERLARESDARRTPHALPHLVKRRENGIEKSTFNSVFQNPDFRGQASHVRGDPRVS